jgi:hypothetical protein
VSVFCYWAFDLRIIYLAIVVSSLFFVLETQVGASGDCVDGSDGWNIGALLGRLLVLWWRLGWIVWFYFSLGWLGICCGICYLQGCLRVGDGWLGCADLACMRRVVVWLVVWRRIYVVVRLVFRASVMALVRRLVRG